MIEVVKGIPIPERRRTTETSEALESMDVGDAAVFSDKKAQYSFASSARRMGYKVSTRKVGDDFMVWNLGKTALTTKNASTPAPTLKPKAKKK